MSGRREEPASQPARPDEQDRPGAADVERLEEHDPLAPALGVVADEGGDEGDVPEPNEPA